uniref:Uncharacterized protein n=1 Tax=Pristionchus pacificus TaxID=54126 RepID=A0A2A6CZA5_PRIPA|eukprot:PDM83458.1 hypothetical protein PRIPAC_35090 [Pristionchus pacificus]
MKRKDMRFCFFVKMKGEGRRRKERGKRRRIEKEERVKYELPSFETTPSKKNSDLTQFEAKKH